MSFELELTNEEVDRIFNKRGLGNKPGNDTIELNDDEVDALLGTRGYKLSNEKRPDSSKFGKPEKSSRPSKSHMESKTVHAEHKSSKNIVRPVEHKSKHHKTEHKSEHKSKKHEHSVKTEQVKKQRSPRSRAASNKLHVLTKESQYQDLLKNNKRVVVFFGSEGCPACKALHPLYERIANRYADNVALAYADVDKYQINFKYVPVFQMYYRGEKKDEIIGATVEELKTFIGQAIKNK